MKRQFVLALAAGSALLSTPAAAKLDLAPASDWELREYDDKCRIARDFGAGEDAVTLWVDKGGPGPSVNLTFIGRPLRDPYGPTVRFAFGEAEKAERSYIKVTSSSGRPVLALFGVQPMAAVPPMDEPALDENSVASDEEVNLNEAVSGEEGPTQDWVTERLSALGSIELERAIPEPLSLNLDGFADAMTQLLGCTEALSERLSGPRPGSPSTPKDQQGWVQRVIMNYPAHLLKKEGEGTVVVRLTINRKGRASFCEVIDFSGPASFNETACLQMLKQARFTPAKSPDGEPRASFWTTRITYALK